MKGILKVYHPDETLKYHIKSTYCKSVYSNKQHFLEVEIITDDSVDHVEDDSLQYKYPQLCLVIYDFPIDTGDLTGQTFTINDTAEDTYTEVDLYDDEEAFLYDNEISFSQDGEGVLQVVWKGMIDDFYSAGAEPIPFKLKCSCKEEELVVLEE